MDSVCEFLQLPSFTSPDTAGFLQRGFTYPTGMQHTFVVLILFLYFVGQLFMCYTDPTLQEMSVYIYCPF